MLHSFLQKTCSWESEGIQNVRSWKTIVECLAAASRPLLEHAPPPGRGWKHCPSFYLALWSKKKSLCLNINAKSSRPYWGNGVLHYGLAWSHVLQDSSAFCLKAFAVKEENKTCGILLSVRAGLAFSSTGHDTRCPPHTPVPGLEPGWPSALPQAT